MRRTTRSAPLSVLGAVLALSLLVAGCGSDGGDASDPAIDPGAPSTDDGSGDGGGGGGTGGTATLTIGDEVWEFTTVRCAIGSDSTGSDDWDFSLSAIQDGLQLSVSRAAEGGRYGDVVELDDIEDFENPRVGWSAPGIAATVSGGAGPFVEVDGKQVSATESFSDTTADDPTAASVPGTLIATCP